MLEKKILDEKTNFNAIDDAFSVALVLASLFDHSEIVKVLLADERTDPNMRNNKVKTAYGYMKVAELLAKYNTVKDEL